MIAGLKILSSRFFAPFQNVVMMNGKMMSWEMQKTGELDPLHLLEVEPSFFKNISLSPIYRLS
jgi:hypothetical protein